ncbi:unnamed protein product [Cochlearia groenlandica]
MVRFSVRGGDDGEGPSDHRSPKRQRLPSIDEEDDADEDSVEEEEEEETQILLPEEDTCQRLITESDDDEGNDSEVVATENQRSSSKDSAISVTLLDSDVLDCPICCEPLKIPIFQCENGHIACSTCCTKLKNKCTLCDLPIGKIRNRVMERVMKAFIVPCPNASFGCTKSLSYSQGSTHDKECVFSPCYCPTLDCNYKGSYKDLFKHFLGHMDNLVQSCPISYVVMVERKEGLLFVVQSFRESHGVYVTMSCIAPSSPIVGEFSCVITALDKSCSITYEFPRVKRVRTLSSRIPEEDFMFIPSFILRGYQFFDLKICINKVDKK